MLALFILKLIEGALAAPMHAMHLSHSCTVTNVVDPRHPQEVVKLVCKFYRHTGYMYPATHRG